MSDFVKSIDNIPDTRFVDIYKPQSVFDETGEDKYRLHRTYTADEIRCCGEGSGTTTEPDTTAPTLTGSDPLPDQTDIAIDAEIVLDFDEAVTLVDGTTVEIRRQSDDVAIKTFDLFSTDAIYENSSTRIRFTNIPFANLTFYYVLIPSGAITDIAGNPFAGYIANQYSFRTVA